MTEILFPIAEFSSRMFDTNNMDFRLKISKLQLKISNNGVKISKARKKMSVIRLKITAFCNGNKV